ncbi:hypothetical protein Tco_0671067 [Tanacetum coccineum]
MAEESGVADVVVVPKFDMQCHESNMTGKDVKNLVRKYNVPLDLHPCAPTEGWTMDKLSDDHIGLYELFLEFSGLRDEGIERSIFVYRPEGHPGHDSDVCDAFSDNDFSIQDVQSLTEMVIDLRHVPFELLFGAGLATTWEFPGFFPVFKDTGGNVVTMSEYLRFPFLSGASFVKGAVIPANHLVGQNTTPPLSVDQPIPDNTDS